MVQATQATITSRRALLTSAAAAAALLPVTALAASQARTLEGVKVKATAISWCWGGAIEFDAETTDMKLVNSVLADLPAMAEA
jgi:hypothetical protein